MPPPGQTVCAENTFQPAGEYKVTRDLRKYVRQTNLRLIAGAMILLFVVGDGLIYLFYGSSAAVMGLMCLLAGMTPVVLVVLIILLLDWITKRANRD